MDGNNEANGNRLKASIRQSHNLWMIVHLLGLPFGSKILDVGCGRGWISIFLARLGYTVTGIDISPKSIGIAKKEADGEGLKVDFIVGDYEDLDLKDEFDAVIFRESLHYTSNKSDVLKRAYKSLKGGGILILFEPNWIHKKYGKMKDEDKATKGMIHQLELKRLIRNVGFKNVRIYYYLRRPFCRNSIRDVINLFVRIVYQTLPFNFTTKIVLKAEK